MFTGAHHRDRLLGGGDLERQPDGTGVPGPRDGVTGVEEDPDHLPVLAEHVGVEPTDAAVPGRGGEVLQQHRAETPALLGGDPTALPVNPLPRHSDEALASELGKLGYPGYAHLSGQLRNPAEFLLDALDHANLDVRTTEGLPWVVLTYPHLDWPWLLREVKLRNRQNRLGFVVALANKMAHHNDAFVVWDVLEPVLRQLEDARLVKEDTMCQESLPQSRKQHVRAVRSRLAAHWNLDTRLSEVDLAHYAA